MEDGKIKEVIDEAGRHFDNALKVEKWITHYEGFRSTAKTPPELYKESMAECTETIENVGEALRRLETDFAKESAEGLINELLSYQSGIALTCARLKNIDPFNEGTEMRKDSVKLLAKTGDFPTAFEKLRMSREELYYLETEDIRREKEKKAAINKLDMFHKELKEESRKTFHEEAGWLVSTGAEVPKLTKKMTEKEKKLMEEINSLRKRVKEHIIDNN
jgi:hypothetical protein